MIKIPFYVHFEKRTLQIVSVSATSMPDEGNAVVEIAHDLGIKFMTGTETVSTYVIGFKDSLHELQKLELVEAFYSNRIDLLQVAECQLVAEHNSVERADIEIDILREQDRVVISYNGEKILKAGKSAKIYFTRMNDPAYLKCAFTLDINILNAIKEQNNLDYWPNPIMIDIADADDLSVFFLKGLFKISVVEK